MEWDGFFGNFELFFELDTWRCLTYSICLSIVRCLTDHFFPSVHDKVTANKSTTEEGDWNENLFEDEQILNLQKKINAQLFLIEIEVPFHYPLIWICLQVQILNQIEGLVFQKFLCGSKNFEERWEVYQKFDLSIASLAV